MGKVTTEKLKCLENNLCVWLETPARCGTEAC